MPDLTTVQFRVLGVLAGAYRGGRRSLAATLTHAAPADGGWSLCERITEDNLVDRYGGQPAGSVPTCATCARRLAKISGAVVLGPRDGGL